MPGTDRCILFCFAHPDDESFSGAGTAMKYAAAGVRTVLVTATRGNRGKVGDPPLCTPEELPARRERELREAARIIGFDELHIFDYRDRELADAGDDGIRALLVPVLRRARPSVVLTFDPSGINRHPDHIAISRFTTDAVAAAADPRWYPDAGAPHIVPRVVWTPPFPPWELGGDRRPAERPGADFAIDVSAWRERRIAALRAHRTQHLSIDKYFFDQPDLAAILDVEIWRQGLGPPLDSRPSRDLFDGL